MSTDLLPKSLSKVRDRNGGAFLTPIGVQARSHGWSEVRRQADGWHGQTCLLVWREADGAEPVEQGHP